MNRNVLSYLDRIAEEEPDAVFLEDAARTYTRREVREKSRLIGSGLCGRIGIGEPVAVFSGKHADTLLSFFGIISAGGCYSYLNPELPAARLEQIVSVLDPQMILSDRESADTIASIFPDREIVLREDLLSGTEDTEALRARRERVIDTDPLYINFTSGSTGVPKGIAVSHRSVIDFIDCFTEIFGITEEDAAANQAPFDFDVSIKDIFSCLKTGARLIIVPREYFSEPVKLIDFLCEKKATVLIWAVSALCLLSTFHALDYRVPETVRKILFSGEVMPLKALKDFRNHLPDTMFVNLYGPTEITCNCTYHILDPERDYADGMPIGRPFPNEDVFLLDEKDRLITESELPGEICVRGTAAALGYYRNPEQTAAHFVQNPLNDRYPEIIYRTGDLGRFNDDGELVFGGRKDFQIKYMGHRIELEEIEREMGAIDGVERCCCLFDEKKSRLKGFYVGTIAKEELHLQMKEKLPVFMVPGSIRQIPAFPLTKNGKIDRKSLAASK